MRNKYVAAVLAFVFGVFGIHRFYLRQNLLGVLYLLLPPISIILSFIDGILFLTEDHKKFDYKYNKEYFAQIYRETPYEYLVNKKVSERQHFIEIQNATREEEPRVKENKLLMKGKKQLSEYDLSAAINSFSKILEKHPNHKEAHYYTACTYSLLEQVDQCLFHLDLAIKNGVQPSMIEEEDALAYLRIQEKYELFKQGNFTFDRAHKESDNTDNLLEKLEKLASLRERGILTESEFFDQKSKIMKANKN